MQLLFGAAMAICFILSLDQQAQILIQQALEYFLFFILQIYWQLDCRWSALVFVQVAGRQHREMSSKSPFINKYFIMIILQYQNNNFSQSKYNKFNNLIWAFIILNIRFIIILQIANTHILMVTLCLVLALTALAFLGEANLTTQTGVGTISSSVEFTSDQDSITDNPLFITCAVLIAFNLFVFILVYCCLKCFKLPYQISVGPHRQVQGVRYPDLEFETQSRCLIQGQKFKGRDCFESNEIISSLPAYIYGRQIQAQISHLDYFTIRQCGRCGGLTKTLEVFKYGKLRECWQTLFMVLISPCFLAFTIQRITSNNILWRKYFCTECGFEKPVQK